MTSSSPSSVRLRDWLARVRLGDRAARDELIGHMAIRLERLARHMLRGYPGVRRWAQTDDVLQGALVRLLGALDQVQPESPRSFLALATLALRRELLDLARHYFGPQGMGKHHQSGNGAPAAQEPLDWTYEPGGLAQWCEFHEQVDRLPAEEREVVDLLFYQGLEQSEAAALLGVSVRTVQRRWQAALLQLHRVLKGEWPGS